MNRRTFTLYEKQVICAKCNGKCAICGKPVKFKKMTIDHKQPLSRGGTNNYNNLQLACLSCNRLKSNLTMQELADKIADITKYNRKQTFFRILGGLTQ